MSQKYAFLDRDGLLIYEPPPSATPKGQIPYQIDSLEKLKVLDGVIEGLQKLLSADYKLIMISNQDGMGTDIFPEHNFWAPQNELIRILAENEIVFTKAFICPHLPEDNCDCRKPKTGLVDEFFRENDVDLKNSFMSGDRNTDRQFAENLGIRFFPAETNGSFDAVIKQLNLLNND